MDFSKIMPLRPPWWAPNGHVQTVLAHLLPSVSLEPGRTQVVQLSDGDQLVTQCYAGKSPFAFALFHGLAGSAESSYMHRLGRELIQRNHSVMLVNHRNCGPGLGLARQPYHSGRGDDIASCVAMLHQIFAGKKVFAIGFSLGANALLFLLSRLKHLAQPDFAIAVNPPVNLVKTVRLIQAGGWNTLYHRRFVNDLVTLVRTVQQHQGTQIAFPLRRLMTMEEFDEVYTAPSSGFQSAQHYYETCSTHQHLGSIVTPTVILMSRDDPFICADDVETAERSPSVALHLVHAGGHLGYLHDEPTPLGTHRWMDYAILEYVDQFIS